MLVKSFAEDQDPSVEDASGNNQEPEYTFEGFTVEFSEKIVLTPPATVSRSTQEKGQVVP